MSDLIALAVALLALGVALAALSSTPRRHGGQVLARNRVAPQVQASPPKPPPAARPGFILQVTGLPLTEDQIEAMRRAVRDVLAEQETAATRTGELGGRPE